MTSVGADLSRGETVELGLRSGRGAIATAIPAATEAAAEMLRRGGNAADAAAAAAWALAVCEPSGSGLGGQATALVHTPGGAEEILDGHSHGPELLSKRNVSRADQRRGYRATTIPSMPATIGALQARHGRLALADTLAPAITLAEEGIPVSRLLRRHIQWCRDALAASAMTARVFLPDGRPPAKGALLRQPDLAATLRRLASGGVVEFYHGEIARSIARDMEAHGGLISERDLAACRMPVLRAPIRIRFRGKEVVSTPPPGGGLQLLLGLRLAEALAIERHAADPDAWHETVADIVQAIFRERTRWPVHPDRVTPSLLTWLLGDARVEEIATELRAGAFPPLRSAEGPGDTTHLAVVDAQGMVVSLTQSIQSLFGAKVGNETLGFLYNNYLCTCPRHRHPSELRTNAMPQSNAAPTIVFESRAGERVPILALGAAGSRKITSSILQVLLNLFDRGMTVAEAIDAPRIHSTLGGRPLVERRVATPGLDQRLRRRFRPMVVKAARSYAMGAVQAVARCGDGWVGAADPRREGSSLGS